MRPCNRNRRMFILIGVLLIMSITSSQPQSKPKVGTTQPSLSFAVRCMQAIDHLDPYANDFNDAAKMIIVLRSADVPKEERVRLALRILKGDFFTQSDVTNQLPSSALLTASLIALSHLSIDGVDPQVLRALEEYLNNYERYKAIRSLPEDRLPEDLKRMKRCLNADPNLVRAIVARLKAVQQTSRLNTPADLEQRIRTVIALAGFTLEELRSQYEESRARNRSLPHPSPSYAEYVMEEIERTVFYAVRMGMDKEAVAQVLKVLDLNLEKSTIVGRPADNPRPLVEVAEIARDPARIVDEIIQANIFPDLYAQLLVDQGISVVPIIVNKLGKLPPPSESGDPPKYRWLSVLFRVLINLLGPEEALPVIESIAPENGERSWLLPYARDAKEAAKKGKVSSFYYIF